MGEEGMGIGIGIVVILLKTNTQPPVSSNVARNGAHRNGIVRAEGAVGSDWRESVP